MKIKIIQQDKKLIAEFHYGKDVDKYSLDKAEDFLLAIDKFIKKRKMKIESLKKASLRFENTGLLTERIIKAIIGGLCFNT